MRLGTGDIYPCKGRIPEKMKSWTRETRSRNVIKGKEPM